MDKRCPTCVNVKLKIADRKGVEIDYCPQCSGIWLDCGELNKIIQRSAAKGQTTSIKKTKILKSHSHSKVKTAVKAVDTVFDIFDFFSDD
ncbi:MAG: zf-TFIIB domain-containing protein [Desulfobacterales bacterium]|nr:zf-TFIIB domain-containing protein [Desulfobacterales bacterium]